MEKKPVIFFEKNSNWIMSGNVEVACRGERENLHNILKEREKDSDVRQREARTFKGIKAILSLDVKK